MAYDTTKLTKLAGLKALAERVKSDIDTNASNITALQSDVSGLKSTVDGIVSTGGEANVIDTVKVNGTEQTITDKTVDISVPTATSELTNDSDYQTSTEVSTAIESAIAATGHASFEVAESVPTAETAEENVLYLVKNDTTGYYDIYALVSGEVVLIDDTSVDLTDYAKTADVEQAIEDAAYVHPTYTEYASGLYKIMVDGTGHVSAAVAVTASDIEALGVAITDTTYEIATDEEVAEMLTEVFGE